MSVLVSRLNPAPPAWSRLAIVAALAFGMIAQCMAGNKPRLLIGSCRRPDDLAVLSRMILAAQLSCQFSYGSFGVRGELGGIVPHHPFFELGAWPALAERASTAGLSPGTITRF